MLELRPNKNLEAIRKTIAERIRPVCPNMSEDEFDTMVTRMALIEWKHAEEATPTSRMAG
jgi:hypothetical protein